MTMDENEETNMKRRKMMKKMKTKNKRTKQQKYFSQF